MITRKIPSSGEELPVVGLGTSGPFEVGASAAERDPLYRETADEVIESDRDTVMRFARMIGAGLPEGLS